MALYPHAIHQRHLTSRYPERPEPRRLVIERTAGHKNGDLGELNGLGFRSPIDAPNGSC